MITVERGNKVIDLEDHEDEEQFNTIKPSCRKWPVSDPMALAYPGVSFKTEEKEQIIELTNLRNLANCPEYLSGNKTKKEVSAAMETEDKKLKSSHKPCKNHPDKYAVREELCYRCFKEKHGKPPYVHIHQGKYTRPEKVDEGKSVSGDNNVKKVKRECLTCKFSYNNNSTKEVCKFDCDYRRNKWEAIETTIDNNMKKMVEAGVVDEFNKTKFITKEGKPVVLPENWGKVDGGDYSPFISEMKEAIKREEQPQIITTKICEIWQVKDGEATAEIIFKGNEFDSCEVSGMPGHFKLEDWLFLGKVAREIERLAGVR